MERLKLSLTHCYGIKSLATEFDFSDGKSAYAIYAPNGSMKSSLAQTFKDVAEGAESRDRIFPERATERVIRDEEGTELAPEMVLVLPPYDEVFGHSEKTSTLLVDQKLRREYESLHEDVDKALDRLTAALKKQAGGLRTVPEEVSATFTANENSFLVAIRRVWDEVKAQNEAPLAEVNYRILFDKKVESFLGQANVQEAIEEYIRTYNDLLAASTYFKKDVFDYHNAATIAKTLKSNGFFDAEHTVTLKATENLEVSSEAQLAELIREEKAGILEDAELRERFAAIEKLITKNAELRSFQAYLANNPELLPRLANPAQFKEDVWKSYLKAHEALYAEVIETYRAARERMEEIERVASKQRTHWHRVIEIFNERFFVPFRLQAKNQIPVMLGEEKLLKLGFVFEDGDDQAEVERADLLEVLSTGEKKALYILNILFEVEVRKQEGQETVFVVDDIADSFDYKNKYAIIQYLKDMAEESIFKQIILTHNFDFFRTVSSRFVGYGRCLMASRTDAGLELEPASGIRNVFVRDWKKAFFTDGRKRLASIPFVRNIVEYTDGTDNDDYGLLTSLLHRKPESPSVTQKDLDKVFKGVFRNVDGDWSDPDACVLDDLEREAQKCLTEAQGANLENKIVLAVAIRIAAEAFMIKEIDEAEFTESIGENQTPKLLKRLREKGTVDAEVLATLDRVVLMTPENIHLNSFMYEPILDMSDNHLRALYEGVTSL